MERRDRKRGRIASRAVHVELSRGAYNTILEKC